MTFAFETGLHATVSGSNMRPLICGIWRKLCFVAIRAIPVERLSQRILILFVWKARSTILIVEY